MRHVSDLCVGTSNSNALMVFSDAHNQVNGERSTHEHDWHSLWEILEIYHLSVSTGYAVSAVQYMHACAMHVDMDVHPISIYAAFIDASTA